MKITEPTLTFLGNRLVNEGTASGGCAFLFKKCLNIAIKKFAGRKREVPIYRNERNGLQIG